MIHELGSRIYRSPDANGVGGNPTNNGTPEFSLPNPESFLPVTVAIANRLAELGMTNPTFSTSLDGYLRHVSDTPEIGVAAVGVVFHQHGDYGPIRGPRMMSVVTLTSEPVDIYEDVESAKWRQMLNHFVEPEGGEIVLHHLVDNSQCPTLESFDDYLEKRAKKVGAAVVAIYTPEDIRRSVGAPEAMREQRRFEIAYAHSATNPTGDILSSYANDYLKKVNDGAPEEELVNMRRTMRHYWNEWEETAAENIREGKDEFFKDHPEDIDPAEGISQMTRDLLKGLPKKSDPPNAE